MNNKSSVEAQLIKGMALIFCMVFATVPIVIFEPCMPVGILHLVSVGILCVGICDLADKAYPNDSSR